MENKCQDELKKSAIQAVKMEKEQLSVILAATLNQDYKAMGRLLRSMALLRRLHSFASVKYLTKATLEKPHSDVLISALECASLGTGKPDAQEYEELPKIEGRISESELPEGGVYVRLVAAMWMHDRKRVDLAAVELDSLLQRCRELNLRVLDVVHARVFFYYSLCNEKLGNFENVRARLMTAYRSAVKHGDRCCEATLLNLLLRSYLHTAEYNLARKFVSKTRFPEIRTNSEHARYMYYCGRIKAVQLDYSNAHTCLVQAVRKSPPSGSRTALGFRTAVHKVSSIVELLMGEIPDKAIFNQKEMSKALTPYQLIVRAVKDGSMNTFNSILEEYSELFRSDDTLKLIQRLHHNVIKAGLRAMNKIYSRLSLKDVAFKLGLPSEEEAAGMVAKAIADGVISAIINADEGSVQSAAVGDVYATTAPQRHLHKRIVFCMQLHNETVRALHYPDPSSTKIPNDTSDNSRREKIDLYDEDNGSEVFDFW